MFQDNLQYIGLVKNLVNPQMYMAFSLDTVLEINEICVNELGKRHKTSHSY
jgi:hypothetical protein